MVRWSEHLLMLIYYVTNQYKSHRGKCTELRLYGTDRRNKSSVESVVVKLVMCGWLNKIHRKSAWRRCGHTESMDGLRTAKRV